MEYLPDLPDSPVHEIRGRIEADRTVQSCGMIRESIRASSESTIVSTYADVSHGLNTEMCAA